MAKRARASNSAAVSKLYYKLRKPSDQAAQFNSQMHMINTQKLAQMANTNLLSNADLEIFSGGFQSNAMDAYTNNEMIFSQNQLMLTKGQKSALFLANRTNALNEMSQQRELAKRIARQ